jgi:hypothetical protein
MKLGHKGHLNTSNKFPMRFFPNPKIFFRFWMNSKNLHFGGIGRNPPNRRG